MPSAVRVLALVSDGFGGYGGIAEYNRKILTALTNLSAIKQVVVLPHVDAKTSAFGPPTRLLELPAKPSKSSYSLAAFRAAYRSIDLVFCGHLHMAPLALAVAKINRVPLWLQVHGIEAWQELSWTYRESAKAANLITSVSRHTRRRLLEWVDIDPARVKVLPNTFDRTFLPTAKPDYLIERYGLRGKQVLLTVARLASTEQYKGHDRVIRILPKVLSTHPRAMYLIVGDGDDRGRLEACAIDMGVRDNVHFAGFIAHEDLPSHYCIADAFVMPSTGEGFGIAFLEAMASGLPVIGGNQDGSMDALADGALGMPINPNDQDELATAICRVLESKAANHKGYQRFNFASFGAHLEGILSETVLNQFDFR